MKDSFNLDCENDLARFISTYGTLNGIALAHKLGLTGKGCKRAANSLSNYAWNKHTAIACRKRGEIATALQYEAICDRIYTAMPDSVKAW